MNSPLAHYYYIQSYLDILLKKTNTVALNTLLSVSGMTYVLFFYIHAFLRLKHINFSLIQTMVIK